MLFICSGRAVVLNVGESLGSIGMIISFVSDSFLFFLPH